MLVQEELKQTPLVDVHRSLKGRMVSFGGWEMPVQYAGILAEYQWTRQKCTIFDTSHMGEFLVEGDCKDCGLDRLVTAKIDDMPLKTCRYAAMLNDRGGIIDDLIVFRMEEKKWFVVVNGATTDKDAKQFSATINQKGRFTDISAKTGKLDVQGPLSREMLNPLVKDIEKLSYYTFDEFDVLGEKMIVSRTGYTGELGYEIYSSWEKTEELWNTILKNAKVKPAGLGARDVLRLEMGYSLYGHELEEDINPLEAGLGRFVDFDKDFIGKAALETIKAQGPKKKIICFVAENRRSPRHDHKIYSKENQEIGFVTSGTFSPSLQRGIGMGFIDDLQLSEGAEILLGDQKSTFAANLTKRPFYKDGSLKN